MWRVFNQAHRNGATHKQMEQEMNTERRPRKQAPARSTAELPNSSKGRSLLTGASNQLVRDANVNNRMPAAAMATSQLNNGDRYSIPIPPLSESTSAASSVIGSALPGINTQRENAQRWQITVSPMKRVERSQIVLPQ